MKYSIAVDLGTQSDFTVISVWKRVQKYGKRERLPGTYEGMQERPPLINEYHLVYLERPDLRTPYPEIADLIYRIVRQPKMAGNSSLIVDATGVGLPVIQMMRENGLSPIPLTITGGYTVTQSEATGGYGVPKRDLVQALNAVLQTGRLKVPKRIKFADQLEKELISFKMRQKTERHTQFEADKESTHDDFVMSFAMNAWWMERIFGSKTIEIQPPPVEYDELTYGL